MGTHRVTGTRLEQEGRGTRVVAFVSEYVAEHHVLEQILSGSVWTVFRLHTCKDAIERICHERTPVVLCERTLPDGYWTDIYDGTSALGAPPEIIVTARGANERLWAEVLNLGGSDVLRQPFDPQEVLATVSAAWLRWHYRQHAGGQSAGAGGR